jgi:hypothetical protein
MPEKMKLKYDGGRREGTPTRGEGYKTYEGPALVPGVYVVRLKRMVHTEIGANNPNYSGNNKGADRFNLLLEVVGPDSASEYVGAAIFEGVNAIGGFSAQICNEFLTAIAGGPGNRADVTMDAFWGGDMLVNTVKDNHDANVKHVTKIGPIKVDSPSGGTLLKVSVVDDKKAEKPRVRVSKWLPYDGDGMNSGVAVAPTVAAAPGLDDDVLAALANGDDRPF